MNNWKYKDTYINSIDDMPKDSIGFIYEVTHTPSNKKYIGKKSLYSTRNVVIGKKELELIKLERKKQGLRGSAPKKKQVIKESDWINYYGSQTEIKSLVKNNKKDEFSREIIMFVSSKKLLTYYECKLLFEKGILETSDSPYLNDNILGKFYRKDFE